jgi:hypothetical protein
MTCNLPLEAIVNKKLAPTFNFLIINLHLAKFVIYYERRECYLFPFLYD